MQNRIKHILNFELEKEKLPDVSPALRNMGVKIDDYFGTATIIRGEGVRPFTVKYDEIDMVMSLLAFAKQAIEEKNGI